MAIETSLEVGAVRSDFPILDRDDLVFLDSAASSQKPRSVIEAMDHYYRTTHANVHRGVYRLAEDATQAFEDARTKVAAFVGASSTREVVFTKNATEAVNLVAHSWARANLGPGDVVVLTEMEHHANLVPWLMLAEATGVQLRYIAVDDRGLLVLDDLDRALDGARLVTFTAMSNVLGTIPPIRHIADAAHAQGAVVMLDGAQFVPHLATDVAELGCDFLAFSGHKMCGPTGIGVLWGRETLLDAMPAFLGGGEMIRDVRLDGWTPNELPWKFEAGTPPIAEAVGLGAAVDYLQSLGMDAVRSHEMEVTAYAIDYLGDRHGADIEIHGHAGIDHRGGVISFAFAGIHPHDLAQVLDQGGVCVRAGHHCAKPLMRRLGVSATVRASFYVYNDTSDVHALSDALVAASDFFVA